MHSHKHLPRPFYVAICIVPLRDLVLKFVFNLQAWFSCKNEGLEDCFNKLSVIHRVNCRGMGHWDTAVNIMKMPFSTVFISFRPASSFGYLHIPGLSGKKHNAGYKKPLPIWLRGLFSPCRTVDWFSF